MAITAQQMTVFNNLEQDELDMVSSFASSLIRNRVSHTDAYYKFQEARNRMLKKNPMSDEDIDSEIHKGTIK